MKKIILSLLIMSAHSYSHAENLPRLKVNKTIDMSQLGPVVVSGTFGVIGDQFSVNGTYQAACSINVQANNSTIPLEAGDRLSVSEFMPSSSMSHTNIISVEELAEEMKALGGILDGRVVIKAVNEQIELAHKIPLLFDGVRDLESHIADPNGGNLAWSTFYQRVMERLVANSVDASKIEEIKRQIKIRIAREVVVLGGVIDNEAFDMTEYSMLLTDERSKEVYEMTCQYHSDATAWDVLSTLTYIDIMTRSKAAISF